MERYLIFIGNDYYAQGGWHDLAGTHAKRDVAIARCNLVTRDDDDCKWGHVVDSETGEFIWGTEYQGYGAPDFDEAFEE